MTPPASGGRTRRRAGASGVGPLPPDKLWRAIVLTTLLVVPAFWSLLAGLVAVADDGDAGPDAGAAIAFGLALLPFVFVAGAFLTQHPKAPSAVLRGMGLCLLVGLPASAVAGDAVTGLVAGVGAGAAVVVRRGAADPLRPRFVAVGLASAYTFVLVRLAGPVALLSAPVFPFTAVGMADMVMARRAERRGEAVLATGDGAEPVEPAEP